MEEHSSSKGEGSHRASGAGFKSSEWLWTFGPVIAAAQQGWWIYIPRHDGNGLKGSAGYSEMRSQRASNALQHVHPNPRCHDVREYGGSPGWSWISWMRICFLMCCINALCKSFSIPGGRKHLFVLHAVFWNPARKKNQNKQQQQKNKRTLISRMSSAPSN